MVAVFLRLKLRLLANGLGRKRSRAAVLAATLVGANVVAALAVGLFSQARDRGIADADLAVLVFCGLLVAWAVLAPLSVGVDETIDPVRLALLPLAPSQLILGLLSAAALGVAPVATGVTLVGVVVPFMSTPAGAAGSSLAVATGLLLCLVASRAVATSLSVFLRSRRGRDAILLVAGAIGAAFLFLGPVAGAVPGTHRLAAILRWTPPGLAASAASSAEDGEVLRSAGQLGGALLGVVALGAGWSRALQHALSTPPPAAAARSRSGLFPRGLAALLPRTGFGATVARSVRYSWRDPRRRVDWATGFLFAGMLALGPAVGPDRPGPTAVFGAAVLALLAGSRALNQFGLDGAALWLDLGSGTDARTLVRGRNTAVGALIAPAILAATAVLSVRSGAWSHAPAGLALALGGLGISLGVANVVSVTAPFAMPERATNALALNTGQGCGAVLIVVVFLAVVAGLGLPLLLLASAHERAAARALLTAVGLPYGALVWHVGSVAAARRLARRAPEILAAVSPHRAV